jgi:hypothetical protein
MKKILYLIALLATTFSCSTNEEVAKKNDKDYYQSVGIKSVVSISQNDPLFLKFKNSSNFNDLNKSGRVSSNDFSSIDLVSFNNTDDKKLLSIRLGSSGDTNARTNGEEIITEVAAVYSESTNEFVVAWVQEYVINLDQKIEIVNHYWSDGSKFLTLTINTEDKKIMSIESFESTTNGRTSKMTWSECMEMAYNACSDDWQCAILCGLVFTKCIAATAIACAF